MLSVGTELPLSTFSDAFLWNRRLICYIFNNGRYNIIFLTKPSYIDRFLQVYQLDIKLNSK